VIRTNTQTAYQAGWLAELKEGDDEYWEYASIIDGRESELCEYLNGKVFPKDDPFWDEYFPPNHFNCRSTVISLSRDEVAERGLKIDDGSECLKKSGLKPSKRVPGNGFNFSPQNSLDKFLEKNPKYLNIQKIYENASFPLPEHIKKYANKNLEKELKEKLQGLVDEATICSLKNIDPKIAKKIIDELPNLIKKYKLHDVRFIGTYTEEHYIKEITEALTDKTPGLTKLLAPHETKIALVLNEKHHNNYDNMLSRVLYYQEKGHWSGNNPDALHTLYHEIGHVIVLQHQLTKNEKFLDKIDRKNFFVSERGSKDINEYIAESFADVMVSGYANAQEGSKKVFDEIQKIIGG